MAEQITGQHIADTIVQLIRAGKRMPQEGRLRSAADAGTEAQEILQETVKLFSDVFLAQRIGVERWKAAEHIALTMTNADQLNVNIISPALMQAALIKAERYVQGQIIAKSEQEKQEQPMPNGVNKMLWQWTMANLRACRAIMPYMPDEAAVTGYMMKLKLNRDEQVKYRQLIRAYINDCIFAKKESKPVASKLFFNQQTRDIKLEILI